VPPEKRFLINSRIRKREYEIMELQNVKSPRRVLSIDVFRGITIFFMIFVNDIARIKDIPGWMKHMPWNVNGINFPDFVFPAFLFIVGMSIPLAMEKALAAGHSMWKLGWHILGRTASLIFIGVLMTNRKELNPELAGISINMWSFLFFFSVILFWNSWPESQGARGKIYIILKGLGLCILLYLAIIYRTGKADAVSWISTSYWGILGQIGWAYLVSSAAYLAFRKNIEFIVLFMMLLIAVRVGESAGTIPCIKIFDAMNMYIYPGAHIAGHAIITMSGVLVCMFLRREGEKMTAATLFRWAIIFSVVMIISGYCLKKFGINKAGAKVSWSLYCTGLCTILFAVTYYVVDILKITSWTKYFKSAGKNPLLAFILPPLIHPLFAMLGIGIFNFYTGWGMAGAFFSLIFTFLILAMTALLARGGVSLRL
jgi:heparan-alpha-glucosaminide N-acetyltransferase